MKTYFIAAFTLLILSFTVKAQGKTEQLSGILNYLEVNDEGFVSRSADKLAEVEVILKFINTPRRSFGFQLRDDKNKLVHQGMLDLLRNAYQYKMPVIIDFEIIPGTSNGKIRAVRYSMTEEDRQMKGL